MTWQRLESASVGADLDEGLEARVADPLWLVGKQWQVGELTGEDAASPVLVEAKLEHAPITRLRPGGPADGGPIIERDGAGLPLETAVERESVRDGPAEVRIAAEAGLQLWRALTAAGAPAGLIPALRRRFPLALPPDDGLDPVGRAQLALLARRSIAAAELAATLERDGPDALGDIPGLAVKRVRDALTNWASWYGQLFSEPDPGAAAWRPTRMEYAFVAAAGVSFESEVRLAAPEYTGGSLDWYSFDVSSEGPPLFARGALTEHDLRVVPTPARFAGQAASRFWQVENADVWFGDISAGPEDLARVAVASYSMAYGDDWSLIPCRLPVGVLVRCPQVTVLDTFGDVHVIRSCAQRDGAGRHWRFFELTGDHSADTSFIVQPPGGSEPRTACPWLLLPPALAGRTESRPVEEVALVRDEVANLAWAAELRIEGAAGRPIDRAALARAERPPVPPVPEDAWRYRLTTPVLEHFVPLVPVRNDDGGLLLQRGRLAVSADGEVQTRGALGRILEPDGPLTIEDGEIPATGARITRTWQMARTVSGDHVLWMGRRKSAGRPLRAPGLVFDEVDRSVDG